MVEQASVWNSYTNSLVFRVVQKEFTTTKVVGYKQMIVMILHLSNTRLADNDYSFASPLASQVPVRHIQETHICLKCLYTLYLS